LHVKVGTRLLTGPASNRQGNNPRLTRADRGVAYPLLLTGQAAARQFVHLPIPSAMRLADTLLKRPDHPFPLESDDETTRASAGMDPRRGGDRPWRHAGIGIQGRVHLRAAVARLDITPSPGTKVVGHVREVKGVRDRLHAVVLLLDDGTTRAALVTLDLISCPPEMARQLREAVGDATGTPASNIMVAASHNHSGPGWKENVGWARKVAQDLGTETGKAVKTMRPVSVGYGEGRIDFNIQRRKVIDGRAVVRLNPDGPCDHRVKVLRFDDGKSLDPVAVLMHAVCHPCVFTWGDKWTLPHPRGYPKMSADFPGEAKSFVEKVYGGATTALFLQGCAGDIRPNLPGIPYRCGDEADIRWAGRDLGCAAVKAADRSLVREQFARRPAVYPIRCASKVVTVPSVKKGQTVQCELQAMKVGPYLFLTLPGSRSSSTGSGWKRRSPTGRRRSWLGMPTGISATSARRKPSRRGATNRTIRSPGRRPRRF